MRLIKKIVSVLLTTCIFATGCNTESSSSISEIASNELSTNITDVSDRTLSFNDLEVVESSPAISESLTNQTNANITNVSDEIFIDNVKYLTNYNENEFSITSKKAMSNLIDLLVESEKWQEDFKLICSGLVDLEGETFYQITLCTENDFSYSNIGTFWVNADNGLTYLKFDPTLDARGYFSEFAINFSDDDYRTRLILFSYH